jgi:hypothetical protein
MLRATPCEMNGLVPTINHRQVIEGVTASLTAMQGDSRPPQ